MRASVRASVPHLVCVTPPTPFFWSFWNFTWCFLIIWRCAYRFDFLIRVFLKELLPFLDLEHFYIYVCTTSCLRNSSYTVPPIILKFYMMLSYHLKICIPFWFFERCIFERVIALSGLRTFYIYVCTTSCLRNSSYTVHPIILKFYMMLSYHLKMCIPFWFFDTCIFERVIALLGLNKFYIYVYTTSCLRNSSYTVHPIILKFYMMLSCHLKRRIPFWFFNMYIFERVIALFGLRKFYTYMSGPHLVCVTPPTPFFRSFWNFTWCFLIIWRCAYHFDFLIRVFLQELLPFLDLEHFVAGDLVTQVTTSCCIKTLLKVIISDSIDIYYLI